MSTKHIKGNALDWAEKDGYCMIHVCNAQGRMGSGIAKQVKQRFPEAYKAYLRNHRFGSISSDIGGYFVNVINLVGQECYGYDNKRYLHYGALGCCLSEVGNMSCFLQDCTVHTIVVPKYMGSALAGGDWDIVLEMVEFILGGCFEILVVEYEA